MSSNLHRAETEDNFSDDEFDSLLANMPLPAPPAILESNKTQVVERTQHDGTDLYGQARQPVDSTLSDDEFDILLANMSLPSLPAPPKASGTRVGNSKAQHTDANLHGPIGLGEARQPVASTSRQLMQSQESLSSTPIAVPPASQIDLDVVEALPMHTRSHNHESITGARERRVSPDRAVEASEHRPFAEMETPRKRRLIAESGPTSTLPSASQVDWEVLAELPSSVRKPIEAAYAKRRKARIAGPAPPQRKLVNEAEEAADPRLNRKGSKIGPALKKKLPAPRLQHVQEAAKGGKRKKSSVSHRVRTIGPSQRLLSKTSLKLATPPAGMNEQGQKAEGYKFLPSPDRISDEQLEALQINVKFFRDLRGQRALQLDLIYHQYQSHEATFKAVTAKTDKWERWRQNFGKPSKVLSVAIPGPAKLSGTAHGGRVSGLEEVATLVEQWVESYKGYDDEEIEEADVARIERFLVDSIDKQRGSGQDLEKVCKIMAWWEDLVAGESSKSQARWEKVLDRIKGKINEICERDHGAPVFC